MTENLPRSCGPCTACCAVVPVRELALPAFTACPHVRTLPATRPGCAIYPDRPRSCRAWNCQWLVEPSWPDALRPDRCGIVVDIIPDLVTINGVDRPALQLWVLPGHEEDFRQQPVMALVLSIIDHGYAVLWRARDTDSSDHQKMRVLHRDPDGALQASEFMHATRAETSGDPQRMARLRTLLPNNP